MNKPTLKCKLIWSFTHKGIYVEVHNWMFNRRSDSFPEQCWNYFLFLKLSKFEDQAVGQGLWLDDEEHQFAPTSPVRISHNYYGNPVLSNLEMHGDITYYDKLKWDTEKVIKVGCDFQHLGDEAGYDLNYVVTDAIRCVDKFLEDNKYTP